MKRTILLGGLAALSLTACATDQQAVPLIFGRTQNVGISVAGSVPDQGAHLSIGYTDRNIAIVPTTSPGGDRIRSMAGNGFEDALSVLGQFKANASGSTTVSAGLGTFFSTGLAARTLADGFRCEMGDCASDEDESGNSTAGNTTGPD